MCKLSQHGKGDMQDIQNLMSAALLSVSILGFTVPYAAWSKAVARCLLHVHDFKSCVTFRMVNTLGTVSPCSSVLCLPLTSCCLMQTEKMDTKCVTWQEANMKMELANMIFDDLIEDTAFAFCDAHHMPMPAEV